jgi:hypothetical protein
MKKIFTNLTFAITFLLCTVSLVASAQTVTPAGPSLDATTTPPTSVTSVGKIICYGSNITLSGPTGADKYQWYKIDASGTKHLVKESTTSGDNLYSETSTDAGYYNYQLVQINTNGCTSIASNPFSVYVMPQIVPVINTTATSICASTTANPQGATTTTTATLSISGLDSRFTYGSYQWKLNGIDIPGATGLTYTVPVQTAAPATLSYTVSVSYTSYGGVGCPATSPTPMVINVVAPLGQPTITFGN